jgi:succinate dehydrogenase/fumarate reductase-like Fe-S protein
MSRIATLLVRRGGASDPARHVDVAFEPGQPVLDRLRSIRAKSDATLAFRCACLNANACKECMILLDGKVVYACTARLEEREMRLDPLPNKPLLRDLATAIAAPDERLR